MYCKCVFFISKDIADLVDWDSHLLLESPFFCFLKLIIHPNGYYQMVITQTAKLFHLAFARNPYGFSYLVNLAKLEHMRMFCPLVTMPS